MYKNRYNVSAEIIKVPMIVIDRRGFIEDIQFGVRT